MASNGTIPKCSLAGVYTSKDAAFSNDVLSFDGIESKNSTSVSSGTERAVMKFLQVMCLRLWDSHNETSSLW